jgi:hypothetical protein
MAEPTATPAVTSTLKMNQIMIVGRIQHVSRFEGTFDHIIITPAPDAYSKPSVCRVSSSHKLGDVGEDLKCLCAYNGWANDYDNKNGEKVRDARGFFKVVE